MSNNLTIVVNNKEAVVDLEPKEESLINDFHIKINCRDIYIATPVDRCLELSFKDVLNLHVTAEHLFGDLDRKVYPNEPERYKIYTLPDGGPSSYFYDNYDKKIIVTMDTIINIMDFVDFRDHLPWNKNNQRLYPLCKKKICDSDHPVMNFLTSTAVKPIPSIDGLFYVTTIDDTKVFTYQAQDKTVTYFEASCKEFATAIIEQRLEQVPKGWATCINEEDKCVADAIYRLLNLAI